MRLEQSGPVAVLHLTEGENRFTPTFLTDVRQRLDEVEALDDPLALVVTGEDKFFSNGLDLDAFAGEDSGGLIAYLEDVHALFARVLTFPVPTVAAINGHAFAGGGMLALAFDHRVMRSDRGFFCLPEVDLGLPFAPGMQALITAVLPKTTAREAMLTGRRFTADECVQWGIVHTAVPEADVLPTAVAAATERSGKSRQALGTIKEQLYADALAVLRQRS
jgi:enoyl-CoA hydratase/carnithine racemase